MAVDFGEKERDFIAGLKENTGRDLSEWMQAISDAGLSHRNDIIDWLRHKGLMFSKASWLERIHHNGGKPIYADVPREAAPRRPPRRRQEASAPVPAATEPAPARPKPVLYVVPSTSPPAPASPPPAVAGDLDALLAKAKAYRPLAQHVLAKIRAASPNAAWSVREGGIFVGAPVPFAVLGISAKELRLHLALGEHPFDEIVKKGQAGGGLGKGEALSHMLVLTDARQVDARLMDLIARAAAGAAKG
jgi:hypothetical protein